MLHRYMGIYLQCLCEITAAHMVVWKADILPLSFISSFPPV